MVDLGQPEVGQGQGHWLYETVDPGWVAPKPWARYVPFCQLHGLRKVRSAPAWLPLTWSLKPATALHAAIYIGPEAAPVPGSHSLSADWPKKSLSRNSSWSGATWHTGFLHAQQCLAEDQLEVLYTLLPVWAHDGKPVKGRNGEPVCITFNGWETWHDLGRILSRETGLELPTLKVLLQTGCTLRWTMMPHQSPPLRALFGNDLAPVLQLEQMATEKAELLQKKAAARQAALQHARNTARQCGKRKMLPEGQTASLTTMVA